MASISHDGDGFRRVQFVDTDKRRKSIRLGKVSKRDAESIRRMVESLLSCKICGTSPDTETSLWISRIAPSLKVKLAKVALIDGGNLPVRLNKTTVQSFLTDYVEKRREGKKPGTIVIWETAISSLIDNLPADIAIQDVNSGNASDWLDALQASGLAATTVYKRIAFARQFFGYAVKHKLIPDNPFSTISVPRPKPKSNVEVPRETVKTLLAVCDPTWHAIVSLARFGGLRCPSEVLSLRWCDVDFKASTLAVPEPKNEHHDGRGVRMCPLFPEIRSSLEKLPKKGEFVIDKPAYREKAMTGEGWKNSNLRTQFLKQLAKADLQPWKRLFHSMRASRQTELELEFGLPAACAWLGNTESVAKESYLMVFEKDWQRAVRGGAESGAASAGNG